MYLGADAFDWTNVYPKDNNGHLGTREEALERVQLAYENGLVAVLGRLKLESESMGIPDRGRFMVVCFCCPCCCINTKFKLGTYEMGRFIKRIDGLSVEVDREVCTGCEECMEVCSFDGMQMIDAKARVNQEKCLGCGRCERVCPSGAISITLEDPKQISDLFKKIEANVDVS
jgi:UDP-glucose 4-epimerase